ncbi:sodium:solute symporter family protein [Thiohalophilus thiocyanatoxydans]|uniref:Na+/proline symporter n=1 Tax=Thiohalophilus thiocyanatoxydans TaxID=381308 RepID=A0A4R8IGI0_9GAMM|nr:sodium:solute symporter family protein [Thiohalophilus thiocyanatoxydans]TDX99675.1 Na+/proline symporter [Thiohalophilus thiocyanatoxydans]
MNSVNSAILDANVGWLILAIFSVIWVWLGWFWGRKARHLDDYMLAGRRVGMALGTATAMATWVTSNTTMVAPQLAFQLGIWGMLGYSLGSVGLMLFAPLARRIRQLLPFGYTSGDFIRLRYGTWTWRVFLVISLCYAIGWLISLGMAGGVLIHALTGIDYRLGMTVILTICVLYTLLGGLRAVIGTDFIQTLLIIGGVVVLAILTINKIGFDAMHESLLAERPELLNLLMPAAVMFLFNNLLFGIGEIFHSNVWWSRAFAFRKDVGFRAYLLAGIIWVPIPIVAGFIALAAPALGLNVPAADMVGPMVAAELLGFGGAVLVFIIVFSALASSLDSLLAATSDLVLQDIYRGHLNPGASDEKLRIMAKRIVIILGIITWLICLPRITTLASLLHYLGAFVASTIWPVVAGLYWRRTTATGALLAMLLGIGSGLLAYHFIGFYVAALVSAVVSMSVVLINTAMSHSWFDWEQLRQSREGSPS